MSLDLKFHPDFCRASDKPSPALVESMRKLGQVHPIRANPDGTIISGHLRYRACQKLGIEPKVKIVTDVTDYDSENP